MGSWDKRETQGASGIVDEILNQQNHNSIHAIDPLNIFNVVAKGRIACQE